VSLVSAELGPRFVFGLTQLRDAPRVLVHANLRRPDLGGVAVLAGAAGSVWRYDDPDELADTIRLVAAGARPPEPSSDAVTHVLDHIEDGDRPIAAMLLRRTPIDEIARVLGISARRVRGRHREIVKRLDNGER
jgi:DNA-binding NarL/FixJ family response regulator